MKNKKRAAGIFVCALLLLCLGGCGPLQKEEEQPQALEIVQDKEEWEANETVLKYNQIFQRDNVAFLFQHEEPQEGFSDEEMGAVAICKVIAQTPNYDFDQGVPQQQFDAVTMELFGKTLKNYNNTKVLQLENGNILSTGWGGIGCTYVLKELTPLEEGRTRAVCYRVLTPYFEEEGVDREAYQKNIYSGSLEGYNPALVEIIFTETAANGEAQLIYHAANVLENSPQPPYSVYSGE